MKVNFPLQLKLSAKTLFSRKNHSKTISYTCFCFQIQMEMVRPKNAFAVICHGDLWLSNILFKYSATSQTDSSEVKPAEVKFIDFQSARFASLATDLVLFLFTSVRVSFS